MTVPAVVVITEVGVGGALTAALAACGLRQLKARSPGRRTLAAAAASGGLACGAVLLAVDRSDEWRLLPAFFLWACVLAAAGLCDAMAQRIPTVLVRPGLVTVAIPFVVGFALAHDWRGLAVSAVAWFASWTIMLGCWRFLAAGFGDVRLAALGGMGLGHANGRTVLLGLAVFAVVVVVQAAAVKVRGGARTTPLPLGPALVSGFVLAATS